MTSKIASRLRDCSVVTATILALAGAHSSLAQVATATSSRPSFGPNSRDSATQTPIKHVIIIIGENRSFDHVFATYVPVKPSRDTVWNLLSEGIVKADGTPGPSYSNLPQSSASGYSTYQLAPPSTAYATLPPALVGGPYEPYGCQLLQLFEVIPPTPTTNCNDPQGNNATSLANLTVAPGIPLENGLPAPPTDPTNYYQYLLTGGTGQPANQPDARIFYDNQSATSLPSGPFQLTQSTHPPYMAYDAYAQSPVHRFFQMWQQLDCSASRATSANPSGCRNDLFPWVEVTVGVGSNGAGQPLPFSNQTTGEGSTAMQFFNVHAGDAPYLKSLADAYTMSDNYHQAVLGGTGANHVMMGTGDAIWFSDGAGNLATPPDNPVNATNPGTPSTGDSSALSEIEDPDPMPGTNNFYTQDGYGGGSGSPTAVAPNANYGGGAYVNCSDSTQPGVGAVTNYLAALKPSIKPNCQAGHYYLVNNYNPGYFGDGTNAYTDTNPANTVFTIPPSNVRTIGNELSDSSISWAYFGDQFNIYLANPYTQLAAAYCNQCNWAQYNTQIMTNTTARMQHLQDTAALYGGIASGVLPAVSWAKPGVLVDGHPASSKLILFEGFVKKIVDGVTANPALAKNTAIFVTFDESGGFYDSGYVQQLDFFGDGSRVPMIVVSKFTHGGHVNHTYTDHVSTLKFIEANWGLSPITARSRDNLPNPRTTTNQYVPTNRPAIGDLMDMFNFNAQ
jgi:phospholipase C